MKKELLPVLARSALFRNIGEREIEGMLKCLDGRAGRYGDGETVLREGDSADALGVVLSGGVRISRTDFNGIRSVLAEAGPGELFAEAFAFAGAGQMADLGVEEEAPSHQVGEGEVAVASSGMERHGLYVSFVVD